MARLFLETTSEQRWVELDGCTKIGRHPAMTVCLADKLVNKIHCTLERRASEWVVEDNTSLNGTFVNSVRLTAPYVLQHGDAMVLGDNRLIFDDGSAPLPVRPPWQPPDRATRERARALETPLGVTLLPEYEPWEFMAPTATSRILAQLPIYRGPFAMFPKLATRALWGTRHVNMRHESRLRLNARTNVDNHLTLTWARAGGLVWGTQPDHDAYMAAILSARFDALVVVMTRDGLTFNFLGKLDRNTNEQSNIASALDEAFAAWGRGESVDVIHGWSE